MNTTTTNGPADVRTAGNAREITGMLPLEALLRAGDCLVIEPEQPRHLRINGEWSVAGQDPLPFASYAQLRARLVEACLPSEDSVGAPSPRLLPIGEGRVVALDVVGDGRSESLWLRPALLPPPDPACLTGDPDRLTEVVRLARGFVVAGGPDVDSARSAVFALAALLAARRPGSVAIVSRDVTYRAPGCAGPGTRATPAGWPELARAARPDLAVLDPALAAGEIHIEDLECVPRVLAGAVGTGLAALATRLIARLTAGDPVRAQAALGTTPFGVVMATPSGEDGQRLPFTARMLSEAQRVAVLRGDAAALSSQFAGS